jgi:hypothetical protein
VMEIKNKATKTIKEIKRISWIPKTILKLKLEIWNL